MIIEELKAIKGFLSGNYRELVVISAAMLCLVLAEHHELYNRWADALLFYAAFPMIAIIVLLKRNPLDFGLKAGDFKVWRLHVLIACLVALPILYITSRFSSFEDYYTIADFSLPIYFGKTIAYMAGWEFIYRGFLLFGLKDRFKEGSILIQMIPFLFLHLGKPELEVISTIPMGIYFGYVAYRGNSFWPAFLIHLFINVIFRVFVNWG